MIKVMKKSFLALMAVATILFSSCKKSDGSTDSSVSPTNPNALTSVLVIPSSVVVNATDLPASSATNMAPVITRMDTSISYSSGSQIILPVTARSLTTSNIQGVYMQVKGATSYFNVPISGVAGSAVYSLPINLPANLGTGKFIMLLKLYDNAANVSAEYVVSITVNSPGTSGTARVSGGEGFTSTLFNLSTTAGDVKISYDTYTAPDKIDVFQNGVWVAGTGSTTVRNTLRRPISCAAATTALGYVARQGDLTFTYNPSLGQNIEVIVSGCEIAGTLWQYTLTAPVAVVNPGTIKIGDVINGGIVFYVDATGSHGLVCATADQGKSAWDTSTIVHNSYSPKTTYATDTAIGTGSANTDKIVAYFGNKNCAASLCKNYRGGGFSDWFLPSKLELNAMYENLKLKGLGSFTPDDYWSSSEGKSSGGVGTWLQGFYSFHQFVWNESFPNYVRAVRKF